MRTSRYTQNEVFGTHTTGIILVNSAHPIVDKSIQLNALRLREEIDNPKALVGVAIPIYERTDLKLTSNDDDAEAKPT